MRILSIFTAVIVSLALYLIVVDRTKLINLLEYFNTNEDSQATSQNERTANLTASTKDTNTPLAVRVIAIRSKSRQVSNGISLRGHTAAARKVEVRAEINGAVISKPRMKGISIKENDVLCQIAAGTRYANLNEAKVRLQEAETKTKVVESLGDKGYTTNTNKLNQQTRLESARANVTKAEYEVSRLLIKAPFDGVLEDNTAELGSFLRQGTLCATVIDLSSIRLIAHVPESQIGLVFVGANAKGTTASGTATSGKVTFISKSADPITRTFQVEVTARNPNLLIRDGETTSINIELESNNAHLLPQSVLTLNDNGQIGVRIVEEKRAKFIAVKLIKDQKNGILLMGLPSEVEVITVGQEFVNDGQLLSITYEDYVE